MGGRMEDDEEEEESDEMTEAFLDNAAIAFMGWECSLW